jgi:hypothetical protein
MNAAKKRDAEERAKVEKENKIKEIVKDAITTVKISNTGDNPYGIENPIDIYEVETALYGDNTPVIIDNENYVFDDNLVDIDFTDNQTDILLSISNKPIVVIEDNTPKTFIKSMEEISSISEYTFKSENQENKLENWLNLYGDLRNGLSFADGTLKFAENKTINNGWIAFGHNFDLSFNPLHNRKSFNYYIKFGKLLKYLNWDITSKDIAAFSKTPKIIRNTIPKQRIPVIGSAFGAYDTYQSYQKNGNNIIFWGDVIFNTTDIFIPFSGSILKGVRDNDSQKTQKWLENRKDNEYMMPFPTHIEP